MEEEKKTNGLKEVTKELLGWEDNKLFRTLNHLTTRPGQIVTAYCKGEKSKYLSPVVYFFGVAALDYFINSISGFMDFTLKSNSESLRKTFSNPIFANSGIDVSGILDQMNSVFSFMISDTGQNITQVPIFLLATWFLYKRYNRSFKENSWFALYTLGHVTLLSIPLILYWYITKDMFLNNWVSFIIGLGYWVWTSKQFYNLTTRKAILLGILMLATLGLIMTFVPIIMILIMQFI